MLDVARNNWLFSDSGYEFKRRPDGEGRVFVLEKIIEVAKVRAEFVVVLEQGLAKRVELAAGQT